MLLNQGSDNRIRGQRQSREMMTEKGDGDRRGILLENGRWQGRRTTPKNEDDNREGGT